MKFFIKQKLFFIYKKYIIEDENRKKVYSVKRKLMSLRRKIKLYDRNDREIVYIKEKMVKVIPKYYIYINGNEVATITKNITLLKSSFVIDSLIGKYEVKGNILDKDFYIEKEGIKIATIRKKLISIRDCYEIDIKDGESQSLVLASVLVIDDVLHEKDS
ncbi:LURP-one-related/scramblase family protein [Clostridium oceanicum]|uniref:LURP-one-related family protein n=1 Tax=Clostridium oceanicum TaxID=1543 RepID=A0ABP3UKK9_9CLOT